MCTCNSFAGTRCLSPAFAHTFSSYTHRKIADLALPAVDFSRRVLGFVASNLRALTSASVRAVKTSGDLVLLAPQIGCSELELAEWNQCFPAHEKVHI